LETDEQLFAASSELTISLEEWVPLSIIFLQ
jgi:hypothetical protein